MIEKSAVVEIVSNYYLKSKGKGPQDLFVFNKLNLMGVLNGMDVIEGAEHDQIFLAVDVDKFLEVADPSDVEELARCGLLYNEEEGFYMFV